MYNKKIVQPFFTIIIFIFCHLNAKADYTKYLAYDTIQVINSGIGGNTTENLILRLQKDCLSYKPDLTIVMVGTNDMVKGKKLPLEKYEKNLSTIVDAIRQSGSKVLLMTIIPFYEPYFLKRHPSKLFKPNGPKAKRNKINDIIQQVANNKKTYFFDLGNFFEKNGNIGEDKNSLICNVQNSGKTDGVHPTSEGYRFIALSIKRYIVDHHLSFKKIVCFGDSITKGVGSADDKGYPEYLQDLFNN